MRFSGLVMSRRPSALDSTMTTSIDPPRSPSPLKIPGLSRKLSLPSMKRKPSLSPSVTQDNSISADPSNDATNAPLPAFLKLTRQDLAAVFVDLEWQQRNRLAAGLQVSDPPSRWARLQGDDVTPRNRYVNVEPFASNRIKLKVAEGSNDYINASPIILGNRRYISTQGPKETSVSHFFRMVAEETSSVAVVIMLTQTHEAGREKCFQYWPNDIEGPPLDLTADPDDENDGFEGQVSVTSIEEDTKIRSVITKLNLRTRNRRKDEAEDTPWQEKEVWHFLFGGWPDFSIPEGDDRTALFELVALSRKINSAAPPPRTPSFPNSHNSSVSSSNDELNPRIVHCSAGVGRTGTFIALDHLLTLLENGRLDDVRPDFDPIADTVDKLRQQRMMMVQGESQFLFLYDTIRDAWLERWREKQH